MVNGRKVMETDGNKPHSHKKDHLGNADDPRKDKSAEEIGFVNHAEIDWHERRKQWVGESSQRSKRMPREQIMSWTTTYEDLLCSQEPFQQPIPLAEMVDFLVDIWLEEGLYD
ncbi:unnamed protein product [Linum tenue]|uniref:Gag1-like clamp domain-containing protein n=1 Tax=Linum tenue TaxID=586396 RepID=A0AAV0PJG3_9ROSI|nr:unnamed protein product [Linum tenue]